MTDYILLHIDMILWAVFVIGLWLIIREIAPRMRSPLRMSMRKCIGWIKMYTDEPVPELDDWL